MKIHRFCFLFLIRHSKSNLKPSIANQYIPPMSWYFTSTSYLWPNPGTKPDKIYIAIQTVMLHESLRWIPKRKFRIEMASRYHNPGIFGGVFRISAVDFLTYVGHMERQQNPTLRQVDWKTSLFFELQQTITQPSTFLRRYSVIRISMVAVV